MTKKRRKRKEEICEDYCFSCKDGGLLIICDYKNCLKAYHPACVGKDDDFVTSGKRWNCMWHSCFICQKSAKFYCFCCPQAVCGLCIHDAEFVLVRGNKGFCQQCLSIALLIEKGSNVDSNGVTVDFKDINTYECLFMSYWMHIKEKEGLSGKCVHSADDLLKNGQNYGRDLYSLEMGKIEENVGESDGDRYLLVSDYDDLEEVEKFKSVKKGNRSKKRTCAIKRKEKSKKKEFVGWGSKSLLEFLDFVGKDTTKELSQYEVTSIITDYCKENKLFDPEKKKRVLCDARLKSLFGKKCLLKNSLTKLLHVHYAENFEQSKDGGLWSSSDDADEKCKKQRIASSGRGNQKTKENIDVQKSCFASVSAENIKLIYLKKSLVEELLKQPESFKDKVVGSFVRIKCNPNDYLQRNSHQLLQIKGVKISSNGQISAETLLQFYNSPEDFPICKLSDDDFTKEECEDLHKRINDGLLKKPTVAELEQKARSLHEDITRHWIARELEILPKRIEKANEKGWRRELCEYVERMQLLKDPKEQSRLLNEVPKVIAEIAELEPAVQDLATDDKPESPVMGASPQTPETDVDCGIFSCQTETRDQQSPSDGSVSKEQPQHLHVLASEVDNDILKGETHKSVSEVNKSCFKEQFPEFLKQKSRGSTSERKTNLNVQEHLQFSCPVIRPLHDQQSSILKHKRTLKVEVVQLNDPQQQHKAEIKHQSSEDLDASRTRNHKNQRTGSKSEENRTSKVEVVELSDNEQDGETKIGHGTLENANDSLWYFTSSYGSRGGPYHMSSLKKCFETFGNDLKFKVWKEGQKIEDAIPLEDAIRHHFPDM